jgi:NACHT domain
VIASEDETAQPGDVPATTGAAEVAERVEGSETVEGWLWAEPDATVEKLPTVTELETLPLDKLSARDAERLFLRILDLTTDVTYAKSYGLPGQRQDGIDVYGRLRIPPAEATKLDGDDTFAVRQYVTLQSKRVRAINPSHIESAVTKFLEGLWVMKSSRFYYATTYDLRDSGLEDAINAASERLAAKNVEFVPWGAEEINELLRDQPRLVERFFGRPWVVPFCGPDKLAELPHTELGPAETRRLRAGLRSLYEAAFASFASLTPRSYDAADEPFVILDVLPQPVTATGVWANASSGAYDQTSGDEQPAERPADSRTENNPIITPSALRKPRRTLRSVRALLEDRRSSSGVSGAIPADQWLTEGDRNLIVGIPGAGKSSLLRFIATDLLAPDPQSAALQHSYGDRLPVWLPFGYLCHHLDDNDANSLTSAVQAWLTSHGRADLYPVVDKALSDERLLLLIDGIDEWPSEGSANNALGTIETFLGHRKAAAFLTSRPYALSRLPFNLTWHRADIAPLDADQQRRIARQYLIPPESTMIADGNADAGTHERMWSKANVDPFLAQLEDVTELTALTRTPLLLALLAITWRGEALPPRRFDLYKLIVNMLVDTHPKMRARASKAGSHNLSNGEFLTVIRAVAYRLKAEETPQPVPAGTMRRLLTDALANDDLVGLDEGEARKMAAEAMAMAEDEFGLLVPQGARHVGFIHRVIGDHLAGRHLAELDPAHQQDVFNDKHFDPTWTDVLLAALNAQASPHTVANILAGVISDISDSPAEWPLDIVSSQAAWRFIAQALAADAKLAPRKAWELFDQIIREVETSPTLTYRADLITALVQAATTNANWRHLEPTFKRWLDATRPYPAPAMRALADLPIDDDTARHILIQGLQHSDPLVRSNAVDAYAARFSKTGTEPAKGDTTSGSALPPVDQALVELIKSASNAQTQAAALMTLAAGWPKDEVTLEHLHWARQTPKTNLRTVALFAVSKNNPDQPLRELLDRYEFDFVLDHLYTEHQFIDDHEWTGLNSILVLRAVTEATKSEQDEFATFALETLRQEPMTDGNRAVCWQLACGPLSHYDSLRDWVISELNDTTDRTPLVLYDLSEMPAEWTDHPSMKEALWARIDKQLQEPWRHPEALTRVLPDDQARTALLAALDNFRPAAAARELIARFRDDPVVRAALDTRFSNDRDAAKLAAIAISHLGPSQGFERIFSLLKAHNATNPGTASQEHVVLGYAVADAWHDFQQAVAGETSDIEPAAAAEVLAKHDEVEVAAACVAIPTNSLGWHIANTIYVWPNQTVDYALAELRSNRHVQHGSSDTIQSAALIAHTKHPGPRSNEVIDLALSQMTPLPAELREVLAHELTQAALTPARLLDVTACWTNDPDDGVRRTSAVGITQALQRAGTSANAPAELGQWRDTIRALLRAYGPSHDEDRQIAWICMLLLSEPDLLDGITETIGDPTPPGVRLTDIYSNPDDLLVELVAKNWTALTQHLGESLFTRLIDSRVQSETDEIKALRALTAAAHNAPDIAELLQQRIIIERTEHTTSRTQAMLNSTPAGIDYLIHEQGHTHANLQRVLRVTEPDPDAGVDRRGIRERWAFTRLLEPWDMTTDELETALREAGKRHPDGVSSLSTGAVARAAYVMLFPQTDTTRDQLTHIQKWFESAPEDRDQRGPATWLEATAITFMATPADQLPLHLERVFYLRRFEGAHEPAWKFTAPLLRRVDTDPDGVRVLSEALDGTIPSATTPLFPDPTPNTGPPEHDTARRVFLAARTLKATGHLSAARLETALNVLRTVDPRLVVADPFVDNAGPLHTLVVTLAEN